MIEWGHWHVIPTPPNTMVTTGTESGKTEEHKEDLYHRKEALRGLSWLMSCRFI